MIFVLHPYCHLKFFLSQEVSSFRLWVNHNKKETTTADPVSTFTVGKYPCNYNNNIYKYKKYIKMSVTVRIPVHIMICKMIFQY